MITRDKLIHSAAIATLSNIIGRTANLVLPYSVLFVYGATQKTDHFFLVFSIAYLFFGTVANALCEATVPLVVRHKLRMRSSVPLLFALALGLLVFVIAVAWEQSIGASHLAYAAGLALMSGAGIANGIATGFLHALERYAIAGLTWGLRLFPLAVCLILFPDSDTLAWLAVGIGIADCIRFRLLVHSVKTDISTENQDDKARLLKKHALTYIAFMAAMLLFGLNPLIDRLIAGMSGPGSISLLEAGNRVYDMLASVCVMGIMTALLTFASKSAEKNHLVGQWRSVVKKVLAWCSVWLLIGIAFGILGIDWWIGTVTGLTEADTQTVLELYWCYLPGMPGLILFSAYVKKVQAQGRLGTLIFLSILSVVLNVVLSLTFRIKMGLPGIALATTVTNYLATLAVIATTQRQTRRIAK